MCFVFLLIIKFGNEEYGKEILEEIKNNENIDYNGKEVLIIGWNKSENEESGIYREMNNFSNGDCMEEEEEDIYKDNNNELEWINQKLPNGWEFNDKTFGVGLEYFEDYSYADESDKLFGVCAWINDEIYAKCIKCDKDVNKFIFQTSASIIHLCWFDVGIGHIHSCKNHFDVLSFAFQSS